MCIFRPVIPFRKSLLVFYKGKLDQAVIGQFSHIYALFHAGVKKERRNTAPVIGSRPHIIFYTDQRETELSGRKPFSLMDLPVLNDSAGYRCPQNNYSSIRTILEITLPDLSQNAAFAVVFHSDRNIDPFPQLIDHVMPVQRDIGSAADQQAAVRIQDARHAQGNALQVKLLLITSIDIRNKVIILVRGSLRCRRLFPQQYLTVLIHNRVLGQCPAEIHG